MTKKNLLFLLILILCIFTVSSVSAHEIDNTTGDSDIIGDDADSFSDLSNIISSTGAGGTINLTKDYNAYSGTAEITISKNLTINGNGHILDANNQSRIFRINNANVILNNITFVNGYVEGYGGAIYVGSGVLTVNNSVFNHNSASYSTQTSCGGAIYVGNGNLTVDNSVFNYNSILSTNDTNTYGGAIYWNGTYGLIANSIFNSNTATNYNGGAVYWRGDNASIVNSTFINNIAVRSGGAVVIYGDNCNIEGSTFINNTAEIGGAVYWRGNSGKLTNSKFDKNYVTGDNNSGNGGAVYWSGNSAFIDNSTFSNNIASLYGGALYTNNESTKVYNSIFKNNTATRYGGAVLAFTSAPDMCVVNSTFESNSADTSGAIHWLGSNSTISNSSFIRNTASRNGGAVYSNGTGNVIEDSKFLNNIAVSAGAVFLDSSNNKIIDSLFLSNSATSYGIIFIRGSNADITGSIFLNNTISNRYVIYSTSAATANDNWFGNTLTNITTKPAVSSNVNVNRWHYLNINTNSNTINLGESSTVYIDLTGLANSDGELTSKKDLADINLNISSYKGVCNVNNVNLVNGKAEVTYTGTELGIGHMTISAITASQDIYFAIVKANRTTPNIKVDASNATIGNDIKINVTLPSDATGKIFLTINGNSYNASLAGGRAAISIPNLSINEYPYSLAYEGDNKYDIAYVSGTVYVSKVSDYAMTAANVKTYIGERTQIVVNLPKDATGRVNVTVGSNSGRVTIVNGTAAINVTYYHDGDFTFTASYPGNDKYAAKSVSGILTVYKISDYAMNTSDVNIKRGETATIVVNFPSDATGNATVRVYNDKYSSRHTRSVSNGQITVNVTGISKDSTFDVEYSGNYKYAAKNISGKIIIEKNIKLSAPDLVKYYGSSNRFYAYLTDLNNNPIANQKIKITINGISYNRTTDASGAVSMAINLNSGNHSVIVDYDGDASHTPATVTSKITILSTVNGSNVVKVFRNSTQYWATFKDSDGKFLANGTAVRFNINGVFYDRYVSGNEGKARLNLNLEQGTYVLTAMNLKTGENAVNNITVLPRISENKDLELYYRNGTGYVVKLIADNGNAVSAGVNVTFNINGVFYTRSTNSSGYARLNLNLQPGTYVITAEYYNCKVSNKIVVKPVLSANDLVKQFGFSSPFVATLVNGQGSPLANTNVTFNINGVFYNRLTNATGHASLNINLQAGEYIITSSYNGANIANKVTVRS